MNFVITGTGRCGSTWAYEVCRSAGLSVRHQSFRHEHAIGLTNWSWSDCEGEISHEVVPSLDRFDARIVLIWRPWLKVVKSWMGLGMFMPGWESPYHMFYESISMFCPKVLDYAEPVQQGAAFWAYWNDLALRNAHVVLPIEGLSTWELLSSIGRPELEAAAPPADINNRNDVKRKVFLKEEDLGDGELLELVDDVRKRLIHGD